MPSLSSLMPEAAAWQASCKGKSSIPEIDRVTTLLRVYHRKAGPEIEERSTLLRDLVAVAKEFQEKNNPTAPQYANLVGIGMQAEKQLTTIETAGKGWNTVSKIFAPSGFGSHGKSNALQNYSAKNLAPTSKQNYWLEGLDPKHRSWGHMPASFFDDWVADAGSTLGFFDWLESKNLGGNLPQVQYLAPDQRWKYMCVFGKDKIMYRHQARLGSRGAGTIPLERFTTFGLETAHSGRNFAIWVCSPNGIFYTNQHKVSEFHHSTFLSGGRVLAAGEWVVAAGKLLLISNKTGHHAASASNLFSALLLLKEKIDLSRTVVMIMDFSSRTDKYVTANEFITKGGNLSACNSCMDFSGRILTDMKAQAQLRCDRHVDWDSHHATTSRRFKT